VNSIDRVLFNEKRRVDQLKQKFPDNYAVHVHQICLTYLTPDAPFYLNFNRRLMNICAARAAISPIPITVFDDLLDVVVGNLYKNVFPSFVQSHGLWKDFRASMLSPPLSPIEAQYKDLEDELLSLDGNSDAGDRYSYQAIPRTLAHKTSQVLEYIVTTASSIYSDVEYDSASDVDFSGYSPTDLKPEFQGFELRDEQPGSGPSSASSPMSKHNYYSKTVSLDAVKKPKYNARDEKRPKSANDAEDTFNDLFEIYAPVLPYRQIKLEKEDTSGKRKKPKNWKKLINKKIHGMFK
jgi:hypothetical protein